MERARRATYASRVLIVGLLTLTLTAGPSLSAQAAVIGGILPANAGVIQEHIVSIHEERFHNVIRQHTDFSCGAAAVATVLRYAYDLAVDENTVIQDMMKVSDPVVVRERGFSMLDMKRYVEAIGMQGAGFRLSVEQLPLLRVPVITIVNVKGYDHFVVLKRATSGLVFMADPALGNRWMSAEAFDRGWNGVIFVIKGRDYVADNQLIDVHAPPTSGHLMGGLLASLNPLTDATLIDVVAPAYYRL